MFLEYDLIGKTIETIAVTGFGVEITTTDGLRFTYEASDGGYSAWQVTKD